MAHIAYEYSKLSVHQTNVPAAQKYWVLFAAKIVKERHPKYAANCDLKKQF